MEQEHGFPGFPLSPDQGVSRFYANLLRRIAEELAQEIGGARLRAVILSGSLAGGEASAFRAAGGACEPGSDIDLYLVTGEGDVESLGRRIPEIRSRLLSRLETPGLVIDLGVTSPDRLGALPPSIANVSLVRHGKTIWGDPSVLEGAARPAPDEIPAWDGFLLLLNRTVEELLELSLLPPSGRKEQEFWYRFGKTVRDLGTSALVVGGAFRAGPGGPEMGEFAREKRLPEGFAREHAFWIEQKVKPDLEKARERYGGEGAFRRVQIRKRELVDGFWDWETGLLFGEGNGPVDRRLRRAERLRRRIRAWCRFAHSGGAGRRVVIVRHLRRGIPLSPLVANYVAAVHLLLSWGPLFGGEPGEEDERLLAEGERIAPVPSAGGAAFRERWIGLRREVCSFWNREVMGSTRPPGSLEME